tara:strand:+ start:95 stop:244 length:150 start_codon:yes stop_codon:yes gene_type:complete
MQLLSRIAAEFLHVEHVWNIQALPGTWSWMLNHVVTEAREKDDNRWMNN